MKKRNLRLFPFACLLSVALLTACSRDEPPPADTATTATFASTC